jgi:serine/threonine protein kinase
MWGRDSRGRVSGQEYRAGDRLRRGRIAVRGLIGSGGQSDVYLAERRVGWRSWEPVALKVAKPRSEEPRAVARAEQRLAREAALLRTVSCWRVPRPLAAFRERGRSHLMMDYVPGRPLEDVLRDGATGLSRPWPERRVVAIGHALAELLAALHDDPAPILVRDLKPGNLIVTPRGHIMLVDLGIACRLLPGERVPASVRGLFTPGYAPPEQWRGDGWEDARADLYALGAVLYQVATGQTAPSALQRMRDPQALVPARALNPDLSPRIERLLADLLALDPRQRPPSAMDVLRALGG